MESPAALVLKKIPKIDISLLRLVVHDDEIPEAAFRESIILCKARTLIIPVRYKKQLGYALTQLGHEVLLLHDKERVKALFSNNQK